MVVFVRYQYVLIEMGMKIAERFHQAIKWSVTAIMFDNIMLMAIKKKLVLLK